LKIQNLLPASLVIILLVAYAAIFFCAGRLQLHAVGETELRQESFRSGSIDFGHSTVKGRPTDWTDAGRDISVRFKMKASAIDDYNNVFQTGPGNTGIRMELSLPSRLGLIIGTKDAQGLEGFVVTETLELQKWHAVELSIGRDNRLKVFLDGVKRIDTLNKQFSYVMSDPAAGTGYNRTRPFKGELSGFELNYVSYSRNTAMGNAIVLIQIVLLSLVVFILAVLVFRNRDYAILSFGVLLTAYIVTVAFIENVHSTFLSHAGVYLEAALLPLLTAAGTVSAIQVGPLLGSRYRTKIGKTDIIGSVILFGFTAAVIFHYILSAYRHFGYPFDTFLFVPADRFNDFFHMYRVNTDLNPYFGDYPIKSNYYPFANIVFYAFSFLPPYPSLFAFTGLFVLPLVIFSFRSIDGENRTRRLTNTFIFSLLSYPVLYTVDRGNLEGLLCIMLLLFVYFLRKQKITVGCVFLSLAIALKGYPALFLVLLLSERRYKETAATAMTALAVSAVSLLMLEGGFLDNLRFILHGFELGNVQAFASNNYVFAGVSLFSLAKLFFVKAGSINNLDMQVFMNIYIWVVTALAVALSAYVMFIEKQMWKKTTLLVGAILLFPHVSFDYKLILLTIPVFLFLNSDDDSQLAFLGSLGFGLLLVPKSYYFFSGVASNTVFLSVSALLNPAIMVAIMSAIIVEGMSLRARIRRKSNGRA
jgi:hypothetical protein